MNSVKHEDERRQHKRYKVDNLIASLHPQFTTLGRVLNISQAGLEFRYVASEEKTNGTRWII